MQVYWAFLIVPSLSAERSVVNVQTAHILLTLVNTFIGNSMSFRIILAEGQGKVQITGFAQQIPGESSTYVPNSCRYQLSIFIFRSHLWSSHRVECFS